MSPISPGRAYKSRPPIPIIQTKRLVDSQNKPVFHDNFLKLFSGFSNSNISLNKVERFLNDITRSLFDFSIDFTHVFTNDPKKKQLYSTKQVKRGNRGSPTWNCTSKNFNNNTPEQHE